MRNSHVEATLNHPFPAQVLAAPKLRVSRWGGRARWRDVRVRSLVNNLFWNANYYDSASAWAGDVDRTAWGGAMVGSVALCALSSLVPMLAATAASDLRWGDYHNGAYVAVAEDLGGAWLGAWVVVSAAAANVGMFVSEMQRRKRVRHWPTSKAPISVVFHSFRLILGRVIISRNGLEA